MEQQLLPIKKYSFKIVQGIKNIVVLTLSKISRTLASDSPNHIVKSSGPFTDMKLAWHSLAIALANKVLPQPGGP